MVCLNLPLLRHTPPPPEVERKSSTLHLTVTVQNEAWLARMRSLEDVLADDFAYDYLLRFSMAEHSSENVILLRAFGEYQHSGGREATEELKQCLLAVGLPCKMRRRLSDWATGESEGDQTPTGAPPADVIFEGFKQSYCVAKHDIFPRFQASEHFHEMVVLHLSNVLQNVDFLSVFLPTISSAEKELIEFWSAANDWYEKHESLASGWATADTIERAKKIWTRHAAHVCALPSCEEPVRRLNARIFEAPSDLYFDVQVLVLNYLRKSYEHFLDAPTGVELLRANGLKRLPTPAIQPIKAHQQIAATGDDYAAGW